MVNDSFVKFEFHYEIIAGWLNALINVVTSKSKMQDVIRFLHVKL